MRCVSLADRAIVKRAKCNRSFLEGLIDLVKYVFVAERGNSCFKMCLECASHRRHEVEA